MSKTFNELTSMLKELIKELNSNTPEPSAYRPEHYNNLKVHMDPAKDARPHVIITIGMSEATYSLSTMKRTIGSLGADERYVLKWFNKSGVVDSLKDLWREQLRKHKESEEKDREKRRKF